MKTKLLLLLTVITMVACSNSETASHLNNPVLSNVNLLFKESSPYIDWYFSDMESFVSYSIKMYPQETDGKIYEKVRNAEDNTITLKNGVKIKLHDEYVLNDNGKTTTLQLTRTGTILHDNSNAPRRIKTNNGNLGPYTYIYSIQNVFPMQIIKPEIDIKDPIPMCYYDNFIVNWTAAGDGMNENGIVVIAEWNGATLYGPTEDISIANVDIIEDTGEAVLSADLFDNMPDEALVNLWMIRGNAFTIGVESGDSITNLTLEEAQQYSQEIFEELLFQYPDFLMQMQPFILGSGAVAGFSFFLIRDL